MAIISGDAIDTLLPNEIKKIQFQLFKEQIEYVCKNSKFYKSKFKTACIAPDDVKGLRDIAKLPFTTKEELRAFNDDFICVPNRRIVDIGATTGTTGTPIILPATNRDWKGVQETIRRNFVSIGITPDDIVQLTVTFDQLFPIGMTADHALKKIGATVLRMGPGNTRRQIEVMKKMKATVIYSSPDYMFTLAEKAREMGYDPARDFSLRMGIYHGHALYDRNQRPTMLKKKIEEIWRVESVSVYGSMEMLTGIVDCRFHCGHHSHPDWVYLEVVDPDTGRPLPNGQEGELVATTLRRQGIPLIRYRLGDITSLCTEKCKCGKTSPRIMAIVCRTSNLLKIKGATVFPQQIEEILMQEPKVTNYALEAYTDENGCDALNILVGLQEVKNGALGAIKKKLKAKINTTPVIKVLSPQEVESIWYRNGDRKPQKFVDRRIPAE